MFKQLLFICVIATIANARAINDTDSETQIIGGDQVGIQQRPFQVALLQHGWQVCGGSIINRNTILTAAHCTGGNVKSFSIRAGSTSQLSGGVVIQASKIINHPNYNSKTLNNDVAIIKLAKNLNFNNKIDKIPLAGPNFEIPDGATAIVSGWGDTTDGNGNYPIKLRQAKVPVINQDDCDWEWGGGITKKMICAGTKNKGSCYGDSGGPLTYQGKHIGIVSFGAGCTSGVPNVYTRTSAVRDFIDKHK